MLNAMTMPAIFGDERDITIQKFNQLEAYCGTGQGLTSYGGQLQVVDFTPENPFARFKVMSLTKYMYISVFDTFIWHTIGPKSFLFDSAQFSLLASGAVIYDYTITNSINSLLIGWRCIPNDANTNHVDPILYMLQNVHVSKL